MSWLTTGAALTASWAAAALLILCLCRAAAKGTRRRTSRSTGRSTALLSSGAVSRPAPPRLRRHEGPVRSDSLRRRPTGPVAPACTARSEAGSSRRSRATSWPRTGSRSSPSPGAGSARSRGSATARSCPGSGAGAGDASPRRAGHPRSPAGVARPGSSRPRSTFSSWGSSSTDVRRSMRRRRRRSPAPTHPALEGPGGGRGARRVPPRASRRRPGGDRRQRPARHGDRQGPRDRGHGARRRCAQPGLRACRPCPTWAPAARPGRARSPTTA